MNGIISAIVVAMVVMLSAESAFAKCYFISLQEFHVTKSADLFSKGNFSPLIALEPGRLYPLAPEYEIEAPHGSMMQGRKYYIPQYLIDDDNRFSLRLMMVDLDDDTPNDLILPPSERSISLAPGGFKNGSRLVALDFVPFSDEARKRANAQRFTFEINSQAGACDEASSAGLTADRDLRRNNELLRIHARVMFYERPYPVVGQNYLPYRIGNVEGPRMGTARKSAFDVAWVNARELIALGKQVRILQESSGYKRVWRDYTNLVKQLMLGKIELRYRDKAKKINKVIVPSLAFHPDWKNLQIADDYPVLPKEWGIAITR